MKLREPINGLTHFFGIILSIIFLILLLTRSFPKMSSKHFISFAIFGGAMILLYLFSTLYHWLPLNEYLLTIFRKIDHTMIFVFIAASYTPICLVSLGGPWGWSIFGSVWGFSLGGLFLKIFWLNAPRKLYTGIYLLMGWIGITAIYPISKVLSWPALLWLFAGGLFYSIGALIYALKKPNPWSSFGFHEIFHIFIILGSSSHFLMNYLYI